MSWAAVFLWRRKFSDLTNQSHNRLVSTSPSPMVGGRGQMDGGASTGAGVCVRKSSSTVLADVGTTRVVYDERRIRLAAGTRTGADVGNGYRREIPGRQNGQAGSGDELGEGGKQGMQEGGEAGWVIQGLRVVTSENPV
ncbi:hypothetical protein BDN71DRAFT_1431069 [Pleurotus eryngii]|uniref:Uncharacterized protein n=1 Tax=Pleurotus eryngii TaxID=5323 RepID=A0A9P6D734_PLEER|nr:hypothetical protein BDN71DRAFT_1431069 [Pleurotus eryngii]